jgi:hypothetical protein
MHARAPATAATKHDHRRSVPPASPCRVCPSLAAHKHSRRVNLIWSCRDGSLVEYFLGHADWATDAWTLIYYTGKRKLTLPDKLPQSVLIFNGRPAWEAIICEVIRGIETGDTLPETLMTESDAYETTLREYATALRQHKLDTAEVRASVRPPLRRRPSLSDHSFTTRHMRAD